MSIPIDDIRSKIYKPYSGYLVFRLLQMKMSAIFNWSMMRTVYGVARVDQQSKPYMLDSLWLMDFIQMYWSIRIQIQIHWKLYLWNCFNNGKRLDFEGEFIPPSASLILALEAPRKKRRYKRRVVPSDASSSKRSRKHIQKRSEEMEDLSLFMNFIGQNGMTVNNNESMFGRLINDVLQWKARVEPKVYNQTNFDAAPVFGDTGVPVAQGPDHHLGRTWVFRT
ncbi:hypothetical protein LINPERPRIM_LOCUS39331 [Linum perenne]